MRPWRRRIGRERSEPAARLRRDWGRPRTLAGRGPTAGPLHSGQRWRRSGIPPRWAGAARSAVCSSPRAPRAALPRNSLRRRRYRRRRPTLRDGITHRRARSSTVLCGIRSSSATSAEVITSHALRARRASTPLLPTPAPCCMQLASLLTRRGALSREAPYSVPRPAHGRSEGTRPGERQWRSWSSSGVRPRKWLIPRSRKR